MVAGMAMAPEAAERWNAVGTVNMSCDKGLPKISVSTTVCGGALVSNANVTPSYTPLHKMGLYVRTVTYGVLIWGGPPP